MTVNITKFVFPYQWQRDRNEFERAPAQTSPLNLDYNALQGIATADEAKLKPCIMDGRLPVPVTPRGGHKDWRYRAHFVFVGSPAYQAFQTQLDRRTTEAPLPSVDVLVTGKPRSGKKFLVREHAYITSSRVLDMTCMDDSLLATLGTTVLADYVMGLQDVDMVVFDLTRHGDLVRTVARSRSTRMPNTMVYAVATVTDPINPPRITAGCHLGTRITLPWRVGAMMYHTNNKMTTGECRSLVRLWTNYDYYSNPEYYLWKHPSEGIRAMVLSSIPESARQAWVASHLPVATEEEQHEDEEELHKAQDPEQKDAEETPSTTVEAPADTPAVEDMQQDAEDEDNDGTDDETGSYEPVRRRRHQRHRWLARVVTGRQAQHRLAPLPDPSATVPARISSRRQRLPLRRVSQPLAVPTVDPITGPVIAGPVVGTGAERVDCRERVRALENTVARLEDQVRINVMQNVTYTLQLRKIQARLSEVLAAQQQQQQLTEASDGDDEPDVAPVCSRKTCGNSVDYWHGRDKYHKQCARCRERRRANYKKPLRKRGVNSDMAAASGAVVASNEQCKKIK